MANPMSNKGRENEDKGRDFASSTADQAKGVAASVADKARDAASAVADKARDVASSAGSMASSAASAVGDKADNATSSVGSGMKSLAGTLRDKGPESGMLGGAKDTVASALERGGEYLEQEGLSGMATDLGDLIRRNPIPAVLIGLGLGYLIGRTLKG